MTSIELVRHAVAHGRDRWWGRPDRDRPLDDRGSAQARALAQVLPSASSAPIAALYSSPFTRCVQTLEPLAEALGLEIRPADALAEATLMPDLGDDGWTASAWLGGRAAGLLDRLVAAFPKQRIVACTHGDVLPATVAVLAGRDGLDVSSVRVRKAARLTLDFDARTCVRVTAHPAPEPEEPLVPS